MTAAELAQRIDYIERWEPGGVPAVIAFLERQAAESEAWASRSPCKGGKRKERAQAEAARLRADAAQLRSCLPTD